MTWYHTFRLDLFVTVPVSDLFTPFKRPPNVSIHFLTNIPKTSVVPLCRYSRAWTIETSLFETIRICRSITFYAFSTDTNR